MTQGTLRQIIRQKRMITAEVAVATVTRKKMGAKQKRGLPKCLEREVNREVSGKDESKPELDMKGKNSASHTDATANGWKGDDGDKENRDKKKEKD